MILGDVQSLPYRVVAILIAITVHEFAHAWTADRLGDPTPRAQGRLSLNPLVHLDPMGSLLLLVAGFGWAKPVQVNPGYFPNWRQGMMVVAAAGPLSNILLLFLVGAILQVQGMSAASILGRFAFYVLLYNAVLAAFNMLPIPPLDGSRILGGLLPPEQAAAYERLAHYGPLVLLVLIMLPWISPELNLLGRVMFPAIRWLVALAYRGFG